MEQPDVVFNQCRFCLKLIEPLGSFSIFGDFGDSQLSDFVQKMLAIEFTAENSHVCGDCFLMWRMIQDYLHACAEAHKIIAASKNFVVRKPWLDNEEEKRMLIGVCRVVKKLYHEMEILFRTVETPKHHPLELVAPRSRKPRKRKRSQGNGTGKGKGRKEKQESIESFDGAIKNEDPVEIDDSAAFQSDKPLEATKRVVRTEDNDGAKEGQDGLILDDSITIVELPIDYVDLVDSSSDDAGETTDGATEDVIKSSTSCYRIDVIRNDEVFKTVCQLCGITTSDMASHLESHIEEKDHQNQNQQQQIESDCSSSSTSRSRSRSSSISSITAQPIPVRKKADSGEAAKVVKPNPLKCNVCGVELTSMLTARLHARLHPYNRTYNSGKSNTISIMKS